MNIYLIDEEGDYFKLCVVSGDPFSFLWTSKIYKKSPETGRWRYLTKLNFKNRFGNTFTFNIKGKIHKVSRFFIQKVI